MALDFGLSRRDIYNELFYYRIRVYPLGTGDCRGNGHGGIYFYYMYSYMCSVYQLHCSAMLVYIGLDPH